MSAENQAEKASMPRRGRWTYGDHAGLNPGWRLDGTNFVLDQSQGEGYILWTDGHPGDAIDRYLDGAMRYVEEHVAPDPQTESALIHRPDAASCDLRAPGARIDRYAFCPACIRERSEQRSSPAPPCCDEGMTCLECDPDATWADLVEYGVDVPMPRHLDLNAGPVSLCTACGRSTWDETLVGQVCGMPQPSGATCDGIFPPASPEGGEGMKHHLTLYSTGRHGSWATCSCGWKSRTFVGNEGAHLAFGEHLVQAAPSRPSSPGNQGGAR